MAQPDPREVVTTKALTVWLAAIAVYIVATLGRSSFGVAGVNAIERFEVDASAIAVFTSVQLGVYALSQIPMGLLIDKFGPRKMLVAGALVMAAGQITLGLTTSYWVAIAARVFIGVGDATGFLSIMRILPYWFPLKKTPLFSQLTSAMGQLGQFLSAVPFLWLLNVQGWSVAFVSLGAIGILVSLAALIAVQDSPEGAAPESASKPETQRHSLRQSLAIVFTSPVCWMAFFVHWMSMVYMFVFGLLWGMPLMTLGMGIEPSTAGMVLVINSIVSVIAGPFMGIISSRAGSQRVPIALVFSLGQAVAWLIFLSSPDPRGLVAVIVLNVIFALLTPAGNYGFDAVRENLPNNVVATGTGMSNMGGFTASMIAAQGVGFLLDYSSNGASYEWSDFRVAWLAVFAVWAFGFAGALVARSQFKNSTRGVVVVNEQDPAGTSDTTK
ncbi:MFS transporter [Corynebacterium breve]|uniref:MFS transporter n=1 Tax=Corynebacterium breve TaxID=3049799 RepID=A0ABY8VJK2_9CORY|nr:MFS transporter [Corynebacterium breve]WIM68374.1 MFS transporter [Corynebacterium breve]